MKRICLNIGDIVATREPAILETILGSCVAVCLWDARNRIGGLNHYLVPTGRAEPERSDLYGVTSVRRLIEQTIKLGADRQHLQARIFGGGSILKSLEDMFTIGRENVRVAREILAEYAIPVVNDFVGAECGIRIAFTTTTGSVSVTCFDQESGRRYQDYIRQVAANTEELAFNSIHAGGFFHERQLFDTLENELLPELTARRQKVRELRVWSAGCTTGEAAYSLAISINESIQSTALRNGAATMPTGDWKTKLLATDTSVKSLSTAMKAIYGIEQLPQHLSEEARSRYFLKGNGAHAGHVRIKPQFANQISFRRFNLKTPHYPFKRQFDLIFCHDGLLAFNDMDRLLVWNRLHRQLLPAGYLLVGQSGLEPDQSLFERLASGIYRKC